MSPVTLRHFIHFFRVYKYFAIFPVAVLEGPIISVISGFLVSRNILSFYGAFLVVFLGDAISDTVFYYIGKHARTYTRILKFLHITDERLAKVEAQYRDSPWKTMIIAKVSYGLGTVFMVASGVSDMPIGSFLWFMGVLNAARSLLLVAIGYYFGRIALELGTKYFSYYTGAVIIIVVGYFIIRHFKNKK